jgi:hypothetical protein
LRFFLAAARAGRESALRLSTLASERRERAVETVRVKPSKETGAMRFSVAM